MARARKPSTRRVLAAAGALALAAAAAAGAQGFRQAPPPPLPSDADPAALRPTNAAAPRVPGAPDGAAQPATSPPDLRGGDGDHSARPAASGATPPTAGASTARMSVEATAPPALVGLQGGGDSAPVCRSACAGALYRCADTAGDGSCQAAARTCRADCDTSSQPVGRLVSPLPQGALAAAGALRALPGSLAAPPPRQ